ncbi:hypothetical protein [Paraburkholderia youngii]|uniref:hypothetical protein n=1 Tax=Paraburkholderia youngii TaxID=2782701 RepID=UPI003D1D6786
MTVGLELAATMVAAHGSTQQWYAEHPANAKALLQVCRNNLKANVAMSEAERAECQRASNAQHFECSVEVTLGQRRLQ